MGIIACAVLASAGSLVTPFLIGNATDQIVNVVSGDTPSDEGIQAVLWIALVFFLVGLLVTVITNIGGYFGDVMSERMRRSLSGKYYDKLMQLPQHYFDNELTGTAVSYTHLTLPTNREV